MYVANGFVTEPTTSIGGGEASVENDQVESAASALPARSVTPPAPPLTVDGVGRAVLQRGLRRQRRHVRRRVVRDGRRNRRRSLASLSWNVRRR